MARSSVSRVMDAFFACSTARRRRGFMSGSGPLRAATMISLVSLVKIRPLALAAISLCLAFHCAPINVSCALLKSSILYPVYVQHGLVIRRPYGLCLQQGQPLFGLDLANVTGTELIDENADLPVPGIFRQCGDQPFPYFGFAVIVHAPAHLVADFQDRGFLVQVHLQYLRPALCHRDYPPDYPFCASVLE